MKGKQILLIYGLIGGLILALSFFISAWLLGTDPATIDVGKGQIFGYTTMLLALSTVFFGVKA